MPNWSRNSVAVKGKKENVLNFINEGLKNSNMEPQKDIEKAFDLLLANAKTKTSEFGWGENRKGEREDNPAEIVYSNGLTMGTFRPVPDTFLKWDTTNDHDNKLSKIKEQQKKTYGAVGWYDYQSQIHYGCKWNATLDGMELVVEGDVATVKFTCDTPWHYPEEWLRWIKQTFKVAVLIAAHEESNAYNFYGEIDYEEADYGDFSEKEGEPQEDDFDNDDDYWDALSEWQSECEEEMFSDFWDYVSDFDVADLDFDE